MVTPPRPQRIAQSRKVRMDVMVPTLLSDFVGQLVEELMDRGERTSRSEIISVLVWATRRDIIEQKASIGSLLRDYRLAPLD